MIDAGPHGSGGIYHGGSAADHRAIAALHAADEAAALANDVAVLRTLFTAEAVILAPQHAPMTRAEIAARSDRETDRPTPSSYRFAWAEVRIIPPYAFEWGQLSGGWSSPGRDEKKETTEVYNVMRILRREADGQWKVHRTIWNEGRGASGPSA